MILFSLHPPDSTHRYLGTCYLHSFLQSHFSFHQPQDIVLNSALVCNHLSPNLRRRQSVQVIEKSSKTQCWVAFRFMLLKHFVQVKLLFLETRYKQNSLKGHFIHISLFSKFISITEFNYNWMQPINMTFTTGCFDDTHEKSWVRDGSFELTNQVALNSPLVLMA